MMRMHPVFTKLDKSPFAMDYAVVDPDMPERVLRAAQRKRHRGLVQLCTIVDGWAPEAQQYDLGRRCLDSILCQPGWSVRILTKNASIIKDFDIVDKYSDRVLIGLSITATPEKSEVTSIVEPNASSISECIAILKEAHNHGFRTYAMLYPLLPGISDSRWYVEQLVQSVVEYGAEEIFVEPVNSRGPGIRLTQEALETNGYHSEAAAVKNIRSRKNWSRYVLDLIRNTQRAVHKFNAISKLRFLLYPKRLLLEHRKEIEKDDTGIIWLE